MQRTSHVNQISIATVAFSSFVQIGDSNIINGLNRAIAVHREQQLFYGKEGNFDSYKVFTLPISLPPINEYISMNVVQENPTIKVNNINITGISSSSFLHVGNSNHIYLEARIKHIRQLSGRRKTAERM